MSRYQRISPQAPARTAATAKQEHDESERYQATRSFGRRIPSSPCRRYPNFFVDLRLFVCERCNQDVACASWSSGTARRKPRRLSTDRRLRSSDQAARRSSLSV